MEQEGKFVRHEIAAAEAAQLKLVLESPSVIIFSLDEEYRYTSFNQNHFDTIRAIWGVDLRLGMDMLAEVIRSPEDRERAKANFDRALAGEEFTLTEEYGDEELDRRFYEDRYCPTRDASGAIVGVSVFVTDVTEREQRAEREREVQHQLEEAKRLESLALLAAGVAHDFNNQLSVILGYTEMARDEVGPEHPASPMLARAEDCARQARELTQQLQAYCGGALVDPVTLDLNDLVRSSLPIARATMGPRSTLRTELVDASLRVSVDRVQLRQVLVNLLRNASESKTDGEVHVVLRTGRTRDTETDASGPSTAHALLEVQDDGEGIPNDVRARIFEPFVSTKGQGRGLGLASAQGIVRSHGGALSVESELGKGSTFRLLLPLEPDGVEWTPDPRTIEDPAEN